MAIPIDEGEPRSAASVPAHDLSREHVTAHDRRRRDRADRRGAIRRLLLTKAREDPHVIGAAITGSAARDAQDDWSDIDLFFGVADDVNVSEALGEWSSFVYDELGALHHFDLHADSATYRAFLLPELLEVDLGFAPRDSFRPRGDGAFRLVFGDPRARQAAVADAAHVVGLTWHHVLHARGSIERGRLWQATYWINAVRDHTLELACVRLDLPAAHAKGADLLPAEILAPMRETVVRDVEPAELSRALCAATRELLRELHRSDPASAERLDASLRELAGL
jgi:hypothetical protein